MKDKYTTADVSRLLDIEPHRVRHYAISRKLPKWGGMYLFTKSDVKKMRKNFQIIDELGLGKHNRIKYGYVESEVVSEY